MDISKWREMIQKERDEKDRFFSSHLGSPIPLEERYRFRRLHYYPPDPDYPFEIELHEHGQKEISRIEDTQGNEREFFRFGEFRLEIGDRENGFSTLMRLIIPSVHIVNFAPALLLIQKPGSPCRRVLVRRIIPQKKKSGEK